MALDYTKEFLENLKDGKKIYFNKFYLESVDFFFRWIKSMYGLDDKDIEDILGDFYYKVWIHHKNIPTDPKFFQRWIWLVLKNNLKDFFKKHKEYSFSQVNTNDDDENNGSFEDNLVDEQDLFEEIDKNYKVDLIKKAINQLDEKYKQVIILRFVEDLSNQQIADILGLTNDVVRQRISRGLRKLKEILSNLL